MTLPPIWSSVDWRLQDSVIARQLGYSRERVRQVRIALGQPKSPDIRRPGMTKRERVRAALAAVARVDAGDTETAKRLGVSHQLVQWARRDLGIPKHKPVSLWRDVANWSLVNDDLNAIWGVRNCATYRRACGSPRAVFDYHGDRAAFQARMDLPEYLGMYVVEVGVAKAWNTKRAKRGRLWIT